MDVLLSDLQEKELRKEFRGYLYENYPHYSKNTVSGHVSYAFYAYRNVSASAFLEALNSEEGMVEVRRQILEIAESGGVKKEGVTGTSGYTSSYMQSLSLLKEFVNQKYGSIANYLERK